MKKLAILLAVVLCIGGLGLPVSGADLPEKITLSAGGTAPLEYKAPQQVERLYAFVPTSSQATQAPAEIGAVPVQMVVTGSGGERTLLFYSNKYASEKLADGSTAWYTIKSGVWDLLTTMTSWNPYAPTEKFLYKGETVTSVYSLLYKDRLYHQVTNPADIRKILTALEQLKPDETKTMGNVGFLIHTDQGRYDIYLDMDSDPSLVDLSVAYTTQHPRIQWISYMDPDKITAIQYSAKAGSKYSLTGSPEVMEVKLNTKSKTTIARIAQYLKNIQVSPDTKRTEKAPTYKKNAALVEMSITFESGTVYHLVGNSARMTISASSMDGEYITYTAASSQMKALRDFISMMPGAKLS